MKNVNKLVNLALLSCFAFVMALFVNGCHPKYKAPLSENITREGYKTTPFVIGQTVPEYGVDLGVQYDEFIIITKDSQHAWKDGSFGLDSERDKKGTTHPSARVDSSGVSAGPRLVKRMKNKKNTWEFSSQAVRPMRAMPKFDNFESSASRREQFILPTSPCMIANFKDKSRVGIPVLHTDVNANIQGHIGSVQVKQTFHNPYNTKIEGIYVFPLPQNTGINDFVMVIGNRRIRGIIRERKEAQRIYKAAKSRGHVASIMNQNRANIFTQKVANIEPGKKIEVQITYYNTLTYDDGWYEFAFPMTIGPRYHPSYSNQKTVNVKSLNKGQRSGQNIRINLNISAGVEIKEVKSPSHEINFRRQNYSTIAVNLSNKNAIPNKDFVLRYRVGDDKKIFSQMVVQADAQGERYFSMLINPPKTNPATRRRSLDMVFVLDCSGSMRGVPMEQMRSAILHSLKQLDKNDRFQIIRFSSNASTFGDNLVVANPHNINRAVQYVNNLTVGGGTEMIRGIEKAFGFFDDGENQRYVCFMTDGLVSNENDILNAVNKHVDNSRIFSFGVGSSPNRLLMNRMAKAGRGTVAYLNSEDKGNVVMDRFFRTINQPVMSKLVIDWGNLKVDQVYPNKLPDLFTGKPVHITGRIKSGYTSQLAIHGMQAGQKVQMKVNVPEGIESAGRTATVPKIWARNKVMYLMSLARQGQNVKHEIRDLALNYNLVSQYTSFICVDSSKRNSWSIRRINSTTANAS